MKRFDADPEVIAEQRARDRYAGADRPEGETYAAATYRAPAIVEHWPCRRCGVAMVGVTADAIERLDMFNRQLARQGEPPIPKNKIVFCPACSGPAHAERAERIAADARAVAKLRAELLTLVDNDLRERVIADQLRKHGVSAAEVAELIRDAKHRRATNRASKTRRPDL